ncbi:MAG: hypothetical protein KGZ74_05885 [Chitinophagaceae bacterium]|nr:hypothetical protein [Chitinophagaceae bacterium]
MKWKDRLLKSLQSKLVSDDVWKDFIAKINGPSPEITLHLAVFTEPILGKLLAGKKTLESRFSSNKVTPYGRVKKGDIVVVKKSGGPVVAIFIAGTVKKYHDLTPDQIIYFRDELSDKLGLSTDDIFWSEKSNSKYATFINVTHMKQLIPFSVDKKDRTAWTIVKEQRNEMF